MTTTQPQYRPQCQPPGRQETRNQDERQRHLYDLLQNPLAGFAIATVEPYRTATSMSVRHPVDRAVLWPVLQEVRDWLDSPPSE